MTEPSESLSFPSENNSTPKRRTRGSRVSSPRSSGASAAKNNLIPVTVQVPREVSAAYDRFSAVSGVNRQHLMREALAMYAMLLQANARVQLPVVTRFVDDQAA